MKKKVIRVGRSLALILDKSLCIALGIVRDSVVSISIEQGAIVIRPIGIVTERVPRGTSNIKPHRDSPARELILLMRDLDARGLMKDHFRRLSKDEIGLGEFAGMVSLGQQVNPLTVERLKTCLTRRKTRAESWDATIEAVVQSVASGPHPTDGDESDIDAVSSGR